MRSTSEKPSFFFFFQYPKNVRMKTEYEKTTFWRFHFQQNEFSGTFVKKKKN